MRTVIRRILWVGMILLAAGCFPVQPAETLTQQSRRPLSTRVPVSVQAKEVAAATNAFGFALLGQLLQDMEDSSQPASPLLTPTAADVCKQLPVKNLFISPLSLSVVLQLALNGAQGTTAEEMAGVLNLTDLSLDASNQASLDLLTSLRSDPSVELLIANSAWLRDGYTLVPDYVQAAQTYFDAEVGTFQGAEDVAQINGWVSKQTKTIIPEIIKEIEPEDVLFLINAIYFKGDWEEAFQRSSTQDWVFRLADGTEQTMPFMHQTSTFPYVAGDDYAALALPYQSGNIQMVIVLPNEELSLASFLVGLTPERWHTIVDGFGQSKVSVSLPRFQLEYEAILNCALQKMGMQAAFSSSADFGRLIDGSNLWLSYVKHKAVVKVNEEGTVAAAVSVGAAAVSSPPSFVVDRPFFFAIHDTQTDAILFMGAAFAPDELTE